MYVDAQTIITWATVLGALGTFIALAYKVFRWYERQEKQDLELKRIEDKFDRKFEELKDHHNADQSVIQEEQTLVIYGLLACLKGLAEQGCNGPVSEAIDKIEKHINKKAHQ